MTYQPIAHRYIRKRTTNGPTKLDRDTSRRPISTCCARTSAQLYLTEPL
jgi:hypothetical protein